MRKILLFISLLSITSCEKVIDIDLSFSNENYVIDAKINKHVNSKSGFSEVLISKSSIDFVNPGYVPRKSVSFIILMISGSKTSRAFLCSIIFFSKAAELIKP